MDEPKKVVKPESIRDWYQRTTRKARRTLIWATAASFSAMGLMWVVADLATLQKLQTFNGALTVPLLGGLWIFMFIFMFLVPSREASFRAQETLEDGVGTLHKFAEQEILPVVQVWQRIGAQVEKEYPELRKRLEGTIAELKTTSQKIEKALQDGSSVATEARPVLAALKRIEDRIEGGLLDDLEDMTQAVKRMSGVPVSPVRPATPAESAPEGPAAGAPAPVLTEPDLSATVSRLKKKKEAAPQPK